MPAKLSEETISSIRRLRAEGLSYAKIGDELEVSNNAARRWSEDVELPLKIKVCSKCSLTEGETTFYKKGLVCKICSSIYRKRHYSDNKQYYLDKSERQQTRIRNFIKELKEKGPCVGCDNFFPACAMDYDHLRDKKFLIANAHNHVTSIASLMVEIEKCELVCAVCHRVRTHNRLHPDDPIELKLNQTLNQHQRYNNLRNPISLGSKHHSI